MRGFFRRWILSRIVKSALVFEKDAIDLYRGMREKLGDGPLRHGLGHLLEEEEMHWRILTDASRGKLEPQELEDSLKRHLYEDLPTLEPLPEETLGIWGGELSKALEREKQTFVFYGNLRRMSKIPAVKKAFEALADMEKEHVEILSRLLGRPGSVR